MSIFDNVIGEKNGEKIWKWMRENCITLYFIIIDTANKLIDALWNVFNFIKSYHFVLVQAFVQMNFQFIIALALQLNRVVASALSGE
jgi:hypothetical protein